MDSHEFKKIFETVVNEISNDGSIVNMTNPARSELWIETLSKHIDAYFENDLEIAVFRKTETNEFFSRGCGNERSEFLYDIQVCEMGKITPPVHKESKPLDYVRKSLIQIESEFAKSTDQTVVDMSKLVCGNADLKVMIGPLTSNGPHNYKKVTRTIARNIKDTLILGFVTHPENWSVNSIKFEIFEWSIDKLKWLKL